MSHDTLYPWREKGFSMYAYMFVSMHVCMCVCIHVLYICTCVPKMLVYIRKHRQVLVCCNEWFITHLPYCGNGHFLATFTGIEFGKTSWRDSLGMRAWSCLHHLKEVRILDLQTSLIHYNVKNTKSQHLVTNTYLNLAQRTTTKNTQTIFSYWRCVWWKMGTMWAEYLLLSHLNCNHIHTALWDHAHKTYVQQLSFGIKISLRSDTGTYQHFTFPWHFLDPSSLWWVISVSCGGRRREQPVALTQTLPSTL